MDSTVHLPDTQSISSSTPSRKRPRENETPSQRMKREKAAERQRRKRERDRNAAGLGGMAYQQGGPSDHSQQPQQLHQQQQPQDHQHHQHHQQQQMVQSVQSQVHSTQSPQSAPSDFAPQELTPEEAARRDKVRAAARERQRKHRQLVKQRKMRDLGLDMGNEVISGVEELHYAVDGQYPQMIPQEIQQPPPHAGGGGGGQHEPPFPQGSPLGGQTFASTLLLSFSCTPLLKQHLLRSLNMTNDELTSMEPVLADAWDHWNHQRQLHYAEQAAKGLPPGPPPMAGPSSYAVDVGHDQQQHLANGHPFPPPPNGSAPSGDPSQQQPSPPNEFRARFHRPLVAPTPFRTFNSEAPGVGSGSTSATNTGATATTNTTTGVVGPGASNASGSGPPQSQSTDAIDPHLSGANGSGGGVNVASNNPVKGER